MVKRAICLAVLLLAITPGLAWAEAGSRALDPDVDAQEDGAGLCRAPIPSVLSKECFDELIGWIALNTSYDVLLAYRSPATVSFCDVGQTVEYRGADLMVEAHIHAAYDVSRRHIYLVRPWSPIRIFDQSVLLHEMIHDIQLTNKDWECVEAPEFEAYFLQDKWLAEHGIHHAFEWQTILELSKCAPGE